MVLLTYIQTEHSNGTGRLTSQYKEYKTVEEAQKIIELNEGSNNFTKFNILVPLGQENLDYKEKFEELYDYVLKQTGVREITKPEKPKTTVKD